MASIVLLITLAGLGYGIYKAKSASTITSKILTIISWPVASYMIISLILAATTMP